MSHEIVELPGITVMGISTRASFEELSKIGDVWRKFHAMGDHRIIEARLSDFHYGVYCEYEGDWTQPYTTVVGCEVAEGTRAVAGMKTVRIEPGVFAMYKLKYEKPNPVFATWEEIWKTPLNRRYQADYDCYGEADGIRVHVGVR